MSIRCSSRFRSETYGVLIYQEQVMQAAPRCWPAITLGSALICCAAPWARKKVEEMAKPARSLRQGMRQGQQYSCAQGQ
jgi:DNA polymerase III alpha subunit